MSSGTIFAAVVGAIARRPLVAIAVVIALAIAGGVGRWALAPAREPTLPDEGLRDLPGVCTEIAEQLPAALVWAERHGAFGIRDLDPRRLRDASPRLPRPRESSVRALRGRLRGGDA